VNFRINPQGDIDQLVMSLDEAEAVFVRKPDTIDSKLMSQLAGPYEAPRGVKIQITLAADSKLSLVSPGQPVIPLVQLKGLTFRTLRCRRGNLADRIRKPQKALTSSGVTLSGRTFVGWIFTRQNWMKLCSLTQI
jgi:hypothetical protein